MGLNPEKMEELKAKYGIDDEAIFEIADSLEPNSEAPLFVPTGEPRRQAAPSSGALSASLAKAMSGEISMAEVLMYMDVMDRKERRERMDDDRRLMIGKPRDDTSGITALVQEMREERKGFQDQMERLVLGKRADDAESRAKTAEQTLEDERTTNRQKEAIEGAVQGAVNQIGETFGSQLNELARRIQTLPENQQKGFWDELFTDYEADLKGQFKGMVLDRLKPPEKPITKTDEEGKTSLDWGGMLDRGEKILDKIIDSRKAAPPRVPVQEVPTQPGGATGPLPEGPAEPAEPVEAEHQAVVEEPTPEPVVTPSPISPQDIDGVGPSRAQELEQMGITDARQLIQISPSHLSDQLGISKEKAEDIVKQAKDLADQA